MYVKICNTTGSILEYCTAPFDIDNRNISIIMADILPTTNYRYYDFTMKKFKELIVDPCTEVVDTTTHSIKKVIKSTIDSRIAEYPPIADQLDMLFHAMDIGEIPKATAWYNAIKDIKTKHPKG